MHSTICHAINYRHFLTFIYHGYHRTVMPHAYGISTAGNEVIRVYQTAGGSSSGILGWKLIRVDQIQLLSASAETFQGCAPGYTPNDSGMSTVFCQLQ